MNLSTKLTLFVTLSKLAIVVFFVLTLPYAVDFIAAKYTDTVLREQKNKVLSIVSTNGVDAYLQGQESFGDYTMLREEFIAMVPVDDISRQDTIETAQRIIDQDTIIYRVLSHVFKSNNKNYLLEVGKATATMGQYSGPLQQFALLVLLSLLFVTLIIDLIFTHHLIKPLGAIIKSKLINQKFPFTGHHTPVNTSTSDFSYLDTSLMKLMDQINDAFEKEREFTANASHELMTPISILQNKIENLMEHAEASDLVQQRLSEMLRTLSRLKKIVNSLLLISRIENEQFTKLDDLDLLSLIEEVMDEISHRLEEQQINFELQLSKNIFIKNVNHDLLFQLFYNLVNNAIRYNKEKGSISITDKFDRGVYTVIITDSGIGIPDEDLPLIFNRFKKSNLSQTGGYGLGLSIVKSIANYHHINLEVASKVNEGTAFSVIFPIEIVRKE
ncbi:MAG: HAMP domain-containing histidine kinase [Pyrinomonadaceae bacterium]|nr:HAMP domain-containing histidine kinase [Sphingobacteriaceae bacterium]